MFDPNMKNYLLFFLITWLMWSCTTLTKIDAYSHMNKVDFTAYSQKGFLFTPEKYNGEYESIGIIDFVKMPGAVYSIEKNLATDKKYIPQYPDYSESTAQWFYEVIDLNEVLEELYQQCRSMGADALMNFNLEPNEDRYSEDISNPTTVIGYRITGFAIKRKQK